jgi:Flavodoxin-like fold
LQAAPSLFSAIQKTTRTPKNGVEHAVKTVRRFDFRVAGPLACFHQTKDRTPVLTMRSRRAYCSSLIESNPVILHESGPLAAADALVLAVPLSNFPIPYKLRHLIDVVSQKRRAVDI